MPNNRIRIKLKPHNSGKKSGVHSSDEVLTKTSSASNNQIVTSDGLPERIYALKLGRTDAVTLKRQLIRLERGNIDTLVASPKIHKVNVDGNDVYSLKASPTLRVVFGVNKDKNKILLYDIINKANPSNN